MAEGGYEAGGPTDLCGACVCVCVHDVGIKHVVFGKSWRRVGSIPLNIVSKAMLDEMTTKNKIKNLTKNKLIKTASPK